MSISPDLLAAAEAGQTILAPNAELASALFEAIERAQRAAGRELWSTPKVRDFASWTREQHSLRHAADERLPRQLSDIEDRELWREVIEASDESRELLDIGVAARAARRARRTVLEYDIPWDRLAAQGTDETATFLRWNRAFETRCRDIDCVGAELLLQQLRAPSEALVWIESPSWRPAARRWLAARARSIAPRTQVQAQTSLLHAATAGREWAALAGWMHDRLNDDPRFRAWVFVPQLNQRRAEIEDAFDARLETRRFWMPQDSRAARYAIAGGTPLSQYAPVRAALALLKASCGSVTFAEFSGLLRASELQESGSDASAAARIELTLRHHGPHESSLAGWLTLAEEMARKQALSPAGAVPRLRAALQALDAAKPTLRMSEWIGAWIKAINSAPWCMRQRWSSAEFQAAQRFRELLAALAGAEAFFGAQGREAAQRILSRSANETLFQPQTGVPPIWISGQALDPWLDYDALWLCGMSETQWPPAVEPVALLPLSLQRSYGVVAADADSQLALGRELLGRWQGRGAQCIFSYSDSTEGRTALPSPLLPQSAREFTPAPAPLHPHWLALKAQSPPMQKFWDFQAPPFSQNERTQGIATLRAQSRCAFRGFAEIRLAAQRLDLPVPGFSDAERGELVHHALQEVWSELGDSDALRSLGATAQSELLQRAANAALHALSRRRDPGARWRQRERTRLSELLGKWLDVERGREAFVVDSLEGEAQVARLGGLELKVRLDRIDRLADGSRVLIDYKTGSAAVDWRGERPDNPQLPIYALLQPEALIAVAYGKVNAADPGFLAESERRNVFKPGGKVTLLEDQPNLAALIEIWSKRMNALASAFAAGLAEVAPTAAACRSCVLQGLCRVPSVLQESDP